MEKKSYICNKLGVTLNFLPDKINFCCSYAEGPFIEYSKDESFNIYKIEKKKKEIIKEFKYGKIPYQCTGCIDYKEKKYKNIFDFLFSKQNSFLVKEIFVNHFKQCDCKCVYCAQKLIYGDNFKQNYELLPLIKELYKNNIIDKKELRVEFQGGNVSLLDEFDDLMNEFFANGCTKFTVLTNGIKYLPILEKFTNKAVINLQISLDSGTKETYKKIKNIDAFDTVLNNIKELNLKTDTFINLKYIILNGVNDNKNEVENFLNIVKNLNFINSVCFDIDYRDILLFQKRDFIIPAHYYDLIYYAKNFCCENKINFVITPYAKQYMENSRNKEFDINKY